MPLLQQLHRIVSDSRLTSEREATAPLSAADAETPAASWHAARLCMPASAVCAIGGLCLQRLVVQAALASSPPAATPGQTRKPQLKSSATSNKRSGRARSSRSRRSAGPAPRSTSSKLDFRASLIEAVLKNRHPRHLSHSQPLRARQLNNKIARGCERRRRRSRLLHPFPRLPK